MKSIWILWLTEGGFYDGNEFIGAFSTKAEAEKVLPKVKKKLMEEYDLNETEMDFEISELKLNSIDYWNEAHS